MDWSAKEIKQNAKTVMKQDYAHICFVSSLVVVLSYVTVISFMLNSMEEIPDTINNISQKISQSDRQQLVTVVLVLVMGVFLLNTVIQLIISVFVKNPVIIGADRMYLQIYNNESHVGKAADIMYCFDNYYRNAVLSMLIRTVKIAVAAILLIVPGFIRYYSFKFVPHILAQNPELKPQDSFEMSRAIVRGQKMKIFLFDLSFLPWHILGFLSFGIIELLWVHPYKNMATAALYLKLTEKPEQIKEEER